MTAALDRLLHPAAKRFYPADAKFLRDSLPDQPRVSFSFTFLTPRRRKKFGDISDPVRIGRYIAHRSRNEVEIWLIEDEEKRWKIHFDHEGRPIGISEYDPTKPTIDLFIIEIKLGLDRWTAWKVPGTDSGETQ